MCQLGPYESVATKHVRIPQREITGRDDLSMQINDQIVHIRI